MKVGARCITCGYLGWFFCVCGVAPERVCDCCPSRCAGCGREWGPEPVSIDNWP